MVEKRRIRERYSTTHTHTHTHTHTNTHKHKAKGSILPQHNNNISRTSAKMLGFPQKDKKRKKAKRWALPSSPWTVSLGNLCVVHAGPCQL